MTAIRIPLPGLVPNDRLAFQEARQPGQPALLARVWQAVKNAFISFANGIAVPFSYIGSKTWSIPGVLIRLPFVLLFGWLKSESYSKQLFGGGYHYFSTPLPREEAKPYLRDACIASSIAVTPDPKKPRKMEETWLDPYGLQVLSPEAMEVDLHGVLENVEVNEKRFLDRNTGLKMMIVTNENEAIITFGAAGAARNDFADPANNPDWQELEGRIWSDVVWGGLFGRRPSLYRQAEALYLAVKDLPELQGKNISLVGHCLGGSLASYVGIKHQVPVNAFNTLALGSGLQKDIGSDKLSHADEYVTHISVSKDFFSDCPKISLLDRIVNLIGIRTPGNFGKHYTIPHYPGYNKAEDGNSLSKANQNRIHNFFAGSMMAHCGYGYRDTPASIHNVVG